MVWTHGPPTAAFLHLLSAFCLLLPHTLLDAQLLHAGLLPAGDIWSTDLDLFVPHEDRIAVLATLQPPVLTTTQEPIMNPVVAAGAMDHLEAIALKTQNHPAESAHQNHVASSTGFLRSASLLRLPTKSSKPSNFGYFAAGGSYQGSDQHLIGGRVLAVPTADYLTNGGKNKRGRKNKSENFDLNNGGFNVPSISQLPVGATIPLANLNANMPANQANNLGHSLPSSDSIPSLSSRQDSNTKNGSTSRSYQDYKNSINTGDNLPLPIARGLVWKPVSPEFLNYVLALLLYAIRYPGVFWGTNKLFSLLFSLQMVLTGGQAVLLTCAFTILYKLHIMGGVAQMHGTDELLLSLPLSVVLYSATVLLLVLSCSAVYLYGYHKFVHFVTRSRQRYQITYEQPVPVGAYSGHTCALVLLVLLCLCSGPLVWDLSRVYRGSLDRVVLVAVISTIVHIFFWIAFWLLLTVKSQWAFKLRVTVARACVSTARSIKLVTDVELLQAEAGMTDGGAAHSAPLLVVGSGRAFAVPEVVHKKAIMGVVHKSQSALSEGDSAVYWHRPGPATLSPRPTRAEGDRKSKGKGDRKGGPKLRPVSPLSGSEDEAGDYALLLEEGGIKGAEQGGSRGLKLPPKLTRTASASAADARYVDRRQILAYRKENEQLQRQLQLQRQRQQREAEGGSGGVEEDCDVMPPLPPPPAGLGGPSHDSQASSNTRSTRSPDPCLAVHDDSAIQRSDSTSTTTSSTATNHQPDQSTSSTNTTTNQSEQADARNRCGSDEDLSQLPADPSNFPSYPRPLRSQSLAGQQGLYKPESTVVIRRQRNLTRELQPPVDPVYGTRSITSFKEDPIYGGRASSGDFVKEEGVYGSSVKAVCSDDILARAQNNANNQQYGSNSSGSAGYHTASNSSGSNSPVPPAALTPGLATPPPPMQPLYPHHKPMLGHSIYGHTSRIGGSPHHSIYGQTSQTPHSIYGQTPVHLGMYGRTGQSKLPQAPQIPLPPIPQGSIPPNIHYGSKIDPGDDGEFPPALSSPSPLSPPPGDLYPGGTNSPQKNISVGGDYVSSGYPGSGSRVIPVGRSSSLRFAPGTPPRHFTNSLPHVMPRSSHYNTGV